MEPGENNPSQIKEQTGEKPRYKPDGRQNLVQVALGVLIGLGIGLVFWLVFGPGRTIFGLSVASQPAVPKINAQAFDFTLNTADGQPVQLADLRGNVVMINFWATWCGPCQVEMPLIQEYADKYKDSLVVLAVNNDESEEQVQAFVEKLELTFPVLLDPGGAVTQMYRVRGFPTTIFIDQAGIIRYEHVGVLNKALLAGYLNDLGAAK